MCVDVRVCDFVCIYVCESVEVPNFAHPHTCKMCAMRVQVFQLEFVCNKQNFAHPHMCKYVQLNIHIHTHAHHVLTTYFRVYLCT